MPTSDELSRAFISVIPRTMHTVRREMRQVAQAELTVPQFRVLALLSRGPLTNGELAESIGVSVPAMSRLVDGLVKRGHVLRRANLKDRRQITLALSVSGKRKYHSLQEATQLRIASHFSALSAERKKVLGDGLAILRELFEGES